MAIINRQWLISLWRSYFSFALTVTFFSLFHGTSVSCVVECCADISLMDKFPSETRPFVKPRGKEAENTPKLF